MPSVFSKLNNQFDNSIYTPIINHLVAHAPLLYKDTPQSSRGRQIEQSNKLM
jgi:hypothetical protein